MTETIVEIEDKMAFLSGLAAAFKEQMHTNVLVKPQDFGPSMPAHKAVLAARSKVFRHMLDSDECKVSTGDSITLPDLNYEELKSLLEVLCWLRTLNVANKHLRALYLAAFKYDIPYLQACCRSRYLSALNSRTALHVLELLDVPSDKILKDATIKFIVNNMEEVVAPIAYDAFAQRSPGLSMQITRAFLKKTKANNNIKELPRSVVRVVKRSFRQFTSV